MDRVQGDRGGRGVGTYRVFSVRKPLIREFESGKDGRGSYFRPLPYKILTLTFLYNLLLLKVLVTDHRTKPRGKV